MPVWIALLMATFGIAMFTARLARERGRSAAGWVVLGVAAAIAGELVGTLLFGLAMAAPAASSMSVGGMVWGFLATLFVPLLGMFAVLGLLARLPARTPNVGGARWLLYRASTKEQPGADCALSVENGRLIVGDEAIDAHDVTAIAADGECLLVSWAGRTVCLMPVDQPNQPRSARERERWTLGLCARLRRLLDADHPR